MTLDTILQVGLDLGFFAVLGFTLVDYLRHRDRVRLVVMLCFASLALMLAFPLLAAVVPALKPLSGWIVVPALLGQPVLVLLLVGFVRPVPRWARMAALAAFIVLTGSFYALLALGMAAESPILAAFAIALVVYFVLLEFGSALGFLLASRQRAGASRSRLRTAAIATALLGAALVLLLGNGLANSPESQASTATNALVRVFAIFSALGYLAAFAPPRALRRLSQQAIVYNFIRDLNALQSGSPIGELWTLLERTARRASGASRAEVRVHAPAPADAGERAGAGHDRVSMPFSSERWPAGRLELDLPGGALFRDDDLELINLLLDRAVRAAEREAFLIEREHLIADLQAASAAKSDFLAAMSHELRTPLNAIIGFSELLTEGGEDAADPATVASFAEHIHGSGLHLLELVNDVLDLARVEAGRLDLKPIRFELDELVRSTASTMQPLADQKGQRIVIEAAPVAIEADPGRVRQVVLNLLSNAVKFTEPGGEIRLSLDQDGDGNARLAVADTGRGIAADDLDRIFEAFQQGSGGGISGHHEGTGLGLALTRQLVEAHGGRVTVASELGAGSTFTVVLPTSQPVHDAHAAAPAFPAGRPRVLVIEDDPAAQELLRVHLEGAGYGVVATASGRQGLAWVAELRPDAVVLDILLPDLDGWEILQRLKGDAGTRTVPVMVVSVVEDRTLGLALGAMDYLVKPVSRELLLEAIGRLTFTTKVREQTVTALVVDPDPDALARYRQLLEPDGFRVIGAVDAASGQRRAIDDRPDLILLDAILPDVDGFELAATLRHDPRTSSIPVWLSAPSGLAPDAKQRLNGNVQGVVASGEDALAALRAWLQSGPPARPLPDLARLPGSRGAARAAASSDAPAHMVPAPGEGHA